MNKLIKDYKDYLYLSYHKEHPSFVNLIHILLHVEGWKYTLFYTITTFLALTAKIKPYEISDEKEQKTILLAILGASFVVSGAIFTMITYVILYLLYEIAKAVYYKKIYTQLGVKYFIFKKPRRKDLYYKDVSTGIAYLTIKEYFENRQMGWSSTTEKKGCVENTEDWNKYFHTETFNGSSKYYYE